MKLWVNGIVAVRDKKPYLMLQMNETTIGQLTMVEARNFAMDILQSCARAEADAMIHKFFNANQFPKGANDALMVEFRNFRAELDQMTVERGLSNPDTGEEIK